ncbi:Arginine--pyruvate transaminase AruH [compost metagenome]|jgi:arginine:pyruvate transaminase|uniref:Arginine--pyruvate transaminase AruH n=1 Tax=Pseudomonas fluorescens TaxID=294 RepID=A0A5E7QYN9_PSEFL|nr:Arginine--pyruvate transaminase AruH [Pseudomonas fluorescens]
MAERMATINNLSKSHTMSGWRVGWVIGPKLLSEHLVNVVFMLFGIPDFTQNDA